VGKGCVTTMLRQLTPARRRTDYLGYLVRMPTYFALLVYYLVDAFEYLISL